MAGQTEWEDALIKHGIIEAPPENDNEDDLALEAIEARQQVHRLENKNLDQLEALEDDEDEDILDQFRKKRMEELKAQQARNKFGELVQIGEQDFIPQVTKASEDVYVVCHLFIHAKLECQLLNKHLATLARKFKDVKFVKIIATECIKNYPDSNSPTILIYHKGDILKQIIGLGLFGGLKMNEDSLEYILASLGVVRTDIEDDPRAQMHQTNVRRGAAVRSDADEDDDD